MNGCIANKITARKGVGRAKSGQLLEAYKGVAGRLSKNVGQSYHSQREIAKSHGISKRIAKSPPCAPTTSGGTVSAAMEANYAHAR